jgi:hypothetical protein
VYDPARIPQESLSATGEDIDFGGVGVLYSVFEEGVEFVDGGFDALGGTADDDFVGGAGTFFVGEGACAVFFVFSSGEVDSDCVAFL